MAHYCNEHKTPFFKKGAMKGYAHPIEGTDRWCNEPEGQAEPKEKEKPFTYNPEKSASIERQVAVKIAFDSRAENEPMAETLIRAESIYNWIHNAVNPTTSAINKVLQPLGMAIPEGEELASRNAFDYVEVKDVKPPKETPAKSIVYATEGQLETLKTFELKHLGKAQEFMDKHGFKKKLTKANADILIDEFVLLEDANND